MGLSAEIRDFTTRPALMTDLGAHIAAVARLPRDLGELCEAIQGDLLHFHWAGAYQVQLTPERAAQQHLRTAAATMDAILAIDERPLSERRAPADRAVGICRHYAVITAAILRAQGVPARSRCGFGAYFNPGTFEDHWVVECWSDAEGRWVLADSQLDALQRGVLKPDFDPLDVPRDRFIIAGDAWRMCRAGGVDPGKFGIMDIRGLWFVAGNVVRDFAALNNMEMLPWDCWGPAPRDDKGFSGADLALIDRLAELTLDADRRFGELRDLYEGDATLRVPDQVFNALTNRLEPVREPQLSLTR